jgi:threonylcarbamoyladenosine tRNA methylthiotransferase MtaB
MKVFLDTIGCRLNQSEIEIMANQFRVAGHQIVPQSSEADLVVINTCTVTSAAASDSRQKVRQTARSGNAKIIVTGCWATLEPEAALELPGVENVVTNARKDLLVSEMLNISPKLFDVEPLARESLPGDRQRTRAFVKVQDGCDNFCTFCITRVARGKGISRTVHQVINDVKMAIDGGVQEVVISGVHLGSWGSEFTHKMHLRDLIEEILKNTDLKRLRLSSLEPWGLGNNFFSLWEDKRLCPHLHLPLQSGSERILKRMARNTNPERYMQIVSDARIVVPEIAITTDMIVGFPDENDEEFNETVKFVREVGFSGGHIFAYSARPGTAAANYANQISAPIRKRRSAVLRAIFSEMSYQYQEKFIGRTVEPLWEHGEQLADGSWLMNGLTGNYLRTSAITPHNQWNRIESIRLTKFEGESIFGEII